MPTVIDSLIVSLSLDPKNFNEGQKAAVESLKKIETTASKSNSAVTKSTNDVHESFQRVTRSALGFLAVIAGGRGLQELFTNSVMTSAAIGRMSANIGMSTQMLSGWENAAKGVGGTASATAATLQNVSQSLAAQVYLGQGNAVTGGLEGLGIPLVGKDGQVLSPDQILNSLGDKFQTMPRKEAWLRAQTMGIDEGTFNLIDQPKAARDAAIAASMNTDPAASAAAEALQKSFANLETQVDGLSNVLMTLSAPSLVAELNNFAKGIWAIEQVLQGKMTWAQLGNAFESGVSANYNSVPHGVRGGSFQLPKGQRNNNPGNLRYVGQPGAHDDGTGFAVFDTPEAGMAALKAQIALDGSRGQNTISSLITHYEGGTDPNDTGAGNPDHNNIKAYIATVSQMMGGTDPNAPLNMRDSNVQAALAAAIASHENGVNYSSYSAGARKTIPLSANVNNVLSGLRNSQTLNNNLPARPANVSINTVNVHAPSADPKKVVLQMGKTLHSSIMAQMANTGLA